MINLEALQAFSIDDGAGGLVFASWIEAYGIEGVPKVPHSITISNEEARLLAKELNAAVTPDEVKSDDAKPMCEWLCSCHSDNDKRPDGYFCHYCPCDAPLSKVRRHHQQRTHS